MIIKKSKAVIKKYKTNTIRSTAIPKDIVDLLDIKDKEKLIWEELTIEKLEELLESKKLKGLFLVYKKESVENVNL